MTSMDKHVGAMCSVAASGSTAESLHRLRVCSVAERVGVERASASISGVCSVAGRGLFPIELIARNGTTKDVDHDRIIISFFEHTKICKRGILT